MHYHLKDLAVLMGGVHVRTAKRWWKKLNSIQVRLKRPLVSPDIVGHGPHKWSEGRALLLISLYNGFYAASGSTPQIARAKYTGDLSDPHQITFSFPSNCHATKTSCKEIQKTKVSAITKTACPVASKRASDATGPGKGKDTTRRTGR